MLDLGPVLTPNAAEALTLTGAPDPEAAARALTGRTGAPVVVTLGAEGALVAEPSGAAERIPALAVDVVDTTGAGDAFNGALAAELAAGAPLADAARLAVAAAGLSCRAPGARAGCRGARTCARRAAPTRIARRPCPRDRTATRWRSRPSRPRAGTPVPAATTA